MRRNRVLTIFFILVAMSGTMIWLGSVLAATEIDRNEGLTVDEGDVAVILSDTLRTVDPEAPGAIITYTLVSIPAHGDLRLTGTPLAESDQFTQGDIDDELLDYAHDDSETLSDSFEFTVTSGTGVIEAVFLITINPINEPPVANDDTFTVPENSDVGWTVGTVSATDPENDVLNFTITTGNTGDTFAIQPTTGQIAVLNNSLLDFEALGSTPHFTLTVEVDDGELTDEATITINVTDVNEPPVANDATFTVPENSDIGRIVGAVSATDPENDPLTFNITAGNTGTTFAINPTTGQIAVLNNSLLDFEALGSMPHFTLTVEVSDTEFIDEATITINVTGVNEPPVVNDATFNVNENSNNGTNVGTVSATDPEDDDLTFDITDGNIGDTFAINPTTGQITVLNNSLLDFEALGSTPHFTLTVEVDDGELTDEATITINVNDINEPPTITPATFTINENSPNDTVVGTVIATDPEGPVTFEILSGNTSSAFAINLTSGQITVANSSALNYEVTPTFNLSIRVTDNGQLGDGTPAPPALTHTETIIIHLIDINEAPTVNDATFSIPENSQNGAIVGTVTASDPDAGDSLTFSITGGNSPGSPDTPFAIHPTTGQITVSDSTQLNANTMPTYNLTVQVKDSGGLVDTATITINITPPPITNLYLPVVLNNYPPVEPNNNCSQAYAIGSGITYQFVADDQEDWYAFTLANPGNLTITLSNFTPAKGQLLIYSGVCGGTLTLLQNNGSPGTTKTINLTNRPAGTYYIRVYSDPINNSNYNLRVN